MPAFVNTGGWVLNKSYSNYYFLFLIIIGSNCSGTQDYERKKAYKLFISAFIEQPQQLNSYIEVDVEIIDENDNYPVFQKV